MLVPERDTDVSGNASHFLVWRCGHAAAGAGVAMDANVLTGWSIGEAVVGKGEHREHSLDASSLYEKLERTILPLFYRDQEGFTDVMTHSIAINASFFNTRRMMQQSVLNAYYAR